MKGTAPVAAAALAVGVGLGYLGGSLLGHGPAAPPRLGAPEPAAASAPATAPAAAPNPPPTAAAPTPASPGTTAPSSASAGALADAVAALPAPVIATGTGAITGTVQTADGQPLAGVLVRATAYAKWSAPKVTDTPPADPDLPGTVSSAVAEWRRDRAQRREALTGADGTYRLEGLTDAWHAMGAWLAGHEIAPRDQTHSHRAKAGMTVDFVANASVRVHLDVRMPDGSAPREARIAWRVPAGGARANRVYAGLPWTTWTPADPTIRVRVGTHRFVAEVGTDDEAWGMNPNGQSGAELQSDETELVLEAGREPAPLIVQLKTRPGISGRVIIPAGEEVPYLMVYHLRQPADGAVDAGRLKREGKGEYFTPHFGRYAFGNLAAGTYIVGATRSHDGPVVVMATVVVADRMVTQDLVLPGGDEAGGLVVRVLGPGGEALPDAGFTLTVRAGRGTHSSGTSATRRKDGSYRVEPPENVARALAADGGGRVSLQVSVPTHGTQEIELAARATECTVRFSAPATLVVTVSGYVGSGHEGRVRLALEPDRAEDDAEEDVDQERVFMSRQMAWNNGEEEGLSPEGRQTLGPVQAGRHAIVVYVSGGGDDNFMGQGVEAVRQSVTLVAGTNAASVALPRLYTLTVTVPKAEPGANVWLARGDSMQAVPSGNRELDASGKATFGPLPAGTYTLHAWGESTHGQMTVHVPAQTEVVFESQARNALRVTVRDPAGTLGAAGLRTGDLIVGANGTEFENEQAMGVVFHGAAAGGEVTLMVRRDGQAVEVKLAAAALQKPKDWGGRLEPAAR